jgi:phage shock protein PspC (stress-responsive transcriptional regulator)
MEKIVNIIISDKDFKVSEPTYSILSNYILFLKKHFNNSEIFLQAENIIARQIEEELTLSGKKIADEQMIMKIIGESEKLNQTGFFKSYTRKPTTEKQIPTRKLYRSRTNRMLGGVCAGFGEYVDLDVSVVRVLLVLSVIFYGSGVLLYFILWIVIPENKAIYENTGIDSKNMVTT